MARTAIGTNDFRAPTLSSAGYTMVRDVVYSGVLGVDISKPNVANRPAVIVLHGNGNDAGDKSDISYVLMAARFADQGFAVFNANYTLIINGATPQSQIDEVETLVAWVRTNAATYNADATRVAIVGVSNGGYIGTMAGIEGTAGTSQPNCVAAWSAPFDWEEAWTQDNGGAEVESYIGVALSGNEATYRNLSPTDRVTAACCPLRIVGSSAEDTSVSGPGVAAVQFDLMETAAQAVGVGVTKRIFTGQVHGLFFDPPVSGADWQGADDVAGTCAWLERTLGSITPTPGRTASGGRTASSGRVAA